MKIACLMCAVWISSPLAFKAAVAAPGLLERAPAERGPAESSGALPATRAQSHEPARVSQARGAVLQGAVPKGGTMAAGVLQRPAAAQRGAGPLARSNADRLDSLLRTQARPIAKPARRPGDGTSRAETAGTGLSRMPGRQGASPASLSRLAGPQIPARAPRSSDAPTPGALVGGPHPAGLGALGGPAMGRAAPSRAALGRAAFGRRATVNTGALDGTQMRRRF
jgi:hypothetical protein